jgi:hypothetical protein
MIVFVNVNKNETVLFAKCNWNDQVKEDEMGRVCSTHVEKRKAYMILVESQKERDSTANPPSATFVYQFPL